MRTTYFYGEALMVGNESRQNTVITANGKTIKALERVTVNAVFLHGGYQGLNILH